MSNSKLEYEQLVQASDDLMKTTEQLIDTPFMQFVRFMNEKNIGMLKSYRALLQGKFDEVDTVAARFTRTNNAKVGLSQDDLIKIGSLFMLLGKITDRMGYVDYLIAERKIDM